MTVKINEVEELTGITRKNIRFYEEQKLLAVRRNPENGYRDYGEAEVRTLRRIKLLRKLGIPIEEIRQMMAGGRTVGDGMRRHLVTLEREQQNLEYSAALCRELQTMDIPLSELDAEEILDRMDSMERSGASFSNKLAKDVRVRYVAPIAVAFTVITLILTVITLMVWAWLSSPEDAPPLVILVILILIGIGFGVGILLALFQRIREIGKGEADDARNY